MIIGELDGEVEQALARAGASADKSAHYVVEPLIESAVVSSTAGVWRVRGDGWSFVLKRLQLSEGGDGRWRAGGEVDHWFYWRREASAYGSGLLDSLVGGLRAPECYGVFDRSDRAVDIWLQDVTGMPARQWNVERYAEAARQLGIAQGTIARTGLPDQPWLSRHWLRDYLAIRRHDGDILADDHAWEHPIVRAFLPRQDVDRARRLWANQSRNLGRVESFPHTLCHFDVHPDNLYDVDGRTVIIDWAFVGIGSLGEDIGALVPDCVTDFHLPPAELPEFFDLAALGYADGLRSAGTKITNDQVRRMVATAAITKYAWIIPALLETATSGRPTLNGKPVAEAAEYWGAASRFLLDLADRL